MGTDSLNNYKIYIRIDEEWKPLPGLQNVAVIDFDGECKQEVSKVSNLSKLPITSLSMRVYRGVYRKIRKWVTFPLYDFEKGERLWQTKL